MTAALPVGYPRPTTLQPIPMRLIVAALAAVALVSSLTMPAPRIDIGGGGGGGGGTAAGGTSTLPVEQVPEVPWHPARVDQQLVDELTAAGGAPVAAVVTTWSQAELDEVERLGIQGSRLRVLPMLLVPALTADQLAALEASRAVRSVWANRRYDIEMSETTWITRARHAWSTNSNLGGLGATGDGVELAVIDTGADGNHEDMDNLIEFCDTTAGIAPETGPTNRLLIACSPERVGTGNPPYGTGLDPRLPTDSHDDDGHGTHVSGTIAGSGDASGGMDRYHSTIGIAPNAKLRVYSANVALFLLNHQILSAYDDITFKKLNDFNEVVAINNSWGGGDGANYDPSDPTNVAIQEAYRAGILSVFAAGNSGPEHNTLSSQCVNPFVVCVAASTKPDSVVMFSSRGRPSQPADTDRDGTVGDSGDVGPDNHDRQLGQRLHLGLYRPTLTAPGVNIFSIAANEPLCREEPAGDTDPGGESGCYVALNGTSMATPHVTGAVGVLVEAYREGHDGKTPRPSVITDILERSANLSKLPGWEAEEQGAGRLDVLRAAQFAKTYPNGLPQMNLGQATPPFAANKYPGHPSTVTTQTGCTGFMSWTAPTVPIPDDRPIPVDPPPIDTERYGQHEIPVDPKTAWLRVTVSWPGDENAGANIYARLWRPGVDPDKESVPVGRNRTYPDQEALGLLDTDAILDQRRWLEIRAPEETNATEGRWKLRVYHRAGGVPTADCDPGVGVSPGFNYTVRIERPIVTQAPTVAIGSPANGANIATRFVNISGTATYPTPWEGVTNWDVPGSGTPTSLPPGPDQRPVLHFHGNPVPPTADDRELDCTGEGEADVFACGGPFLFEDATLAATGPARFEVPNPIFDSSQPQNPVDPNWIWEVDEETTLQGPMTIEFWASCGACSTATGFSADWIIRLWADEPDDPDGPEFEQRVTATPTAPEVPQKLTVTVSVPAMTFSESLVLHIDPVYIDSQNDTRIYYDSQTPCSAEVTGACDSLVRMPVGTTGTGGDELVPENVRVTDVHNGLRIAWNPVTGVDRYRIYRSTDPTFVPGPATFLADLNPAPNCTSPSQMGWPSHQRTGARCYNDRTASNLVTYYYRVAAVGAEGESAASELAYGRRTQFDRQVKLKVDRLYGPQYWEYAKLDNNAGTNWTYKWDTFQLLGGTHRFAARSFNQGIGSTKALRNVTLDPDAPARDPIVALTKTGPLTTTAGARITYTISYENLGPAASQNARITDYLPPELNAASIVPANGGVYNSSTHTITWNLGTVNAGARGSVSFSGIVRRTAPPLTLIVNQATFTGQLTLSNDAAASTLVVE